MAYGRRKKGGQKLSDLSKRRRQTAAKSKAGKLKPMVIEPSLSKLRVSKGQAKGKGGSALKALSKTKAAAKKAVSKPMAKTRSQAARNVAAGSKARTPSAATRRQARANIARADKNTKNRQELAALKKAGNKGSWTDFIPQMSVKGAEKAGSGLRLGGEVGLTLAALAGSGGTAAPAVVGTRGGQAVLSVLNKAKKLLKGKPKAKPSTATTSARPSARPSGTPRKPSGPGSRTPKKPTGPGSRTTRRSSSAESPNKKVQRQKKREAKKTERRERLDSGSVRMGIQKRGAALTRGRRTQAQKRADRQRRRKYNL